MWVLMAFWWKAGTSGGRIGSGNQKIMCSIFNALSISNLPELRDYAKSKGVKLIMHPETSGSTRNMNVILDAAFNSRR